MNVLIVCEFSGIVRDAFIARGHAAMSNDLLETEFTGPHFCGDCFDAIASRDFWDLIIMHPPCTALALSGNSTYGRGMPKHSARIASVEWTTKLWNFAKSKSQRVVLENPKNVLGASIGKHTQAIHPWQFGHLEQKETWLWIHGLSPLVPTQIVYDEMMKLPRNIRERLHYLPPSPDRAKERSRTYRGIADAMAEQWGSL